MIRRFATMTVILLVAAAVLPADFSYRETTTITGGAMQAMLKVAGVFSKQAREPMNATVALKGNRLAHRNANSASIIDLDAQTITHIDLQKKTYSVMTFEQMKQMIEEASRKMQQQSKDNDAELNWKVSANSTGNSKQIAGFDAKEMLVKMEMEGTDKKSGQKGGMDIVMHTWIAPGVPGYAEVREFYRKMGEKLNWTPGGSMFMQRPDIAKGMAEAYKEMSKLDGTPVLTTMAMGAAGTVNESSGQASSSSASAPAKQQEKPSVGSAIGGALGGKFGLGRKKTQEPPPQQEEPHAQSGGGSASLLEMTTEYSGFSSSPADPSMFEVPAGFKKVEPDNRRMQ